MLIFEASKVSFIRLTFWRNYLQIPQILKYTKIKCRLVPIPGGSNDFFAAVHNYREVIAYHKFQ